MNTPTQCEALAEVIKMHNRLTCDALTYQVTPPPRVTFYQTLPFFLFSLSEPMQQEQKSSPLWTAPHFITH
jgi:hypothetical protein